MEKYIQRTFKNKENIEKSDKVGCYNCKKILKKEDVDFLRELDNTETGLCKHCGYDTIITEDLLKEDGKELNEKFLEDLHEFAFGSSSRFEIEELRRINK